MRPSFSGRASALAAAAAAVALLAPTFTAHAQNAAQNAALTGKVTSAAEGPMEGVIVSAKREGSNKTVSVVTHADGGYSFPRDRLEPGRYRLSIRAVSYVLADRAKLQAVDVPGAASVDLELRASNPLELAYQLTDPEWLASYPLDDKTKWEVFRDCSRCHTLRRPSMSTYDQEELGLVLMRMVYSAGSSPMSYQLPAAQARHWGRFENGKPSGLQLRQAEVVSQINLSKGMWPYELKTLPRPKAKETEVIYTTWDLPAASRPHDTRIAADGKIWFNHFNDNVIGRLDPKTGEVKEWRWPYRAKEGSFAPTGARTLMGPDQRGRWYIGNQAQGGVVVFDPSTEQFEFHDPPGGGEMIDVSGAKVDGKAWRAEASPVNGGGVYQIDLETWEHKAVKGTPERPLYAYDVAADSRNNVYGGARGGQYIWKIDAKTLEAKFYDIPLEPRSVGGGGNGMRRGIVDAQDRLWWGGFDGNFVGMLDPTQPPGREIKLYPMPPWFFPYDAQHDNQGYTWTGGIYSDRVARLDVEKGEWTYYLLPFEANIRDINLQPAARGGLSGLWLGHTHEAMITLVEPQSK